jgi:hypothetical protein
MLRRPAPEKPKLLSMTKIGAFRFFHSIRYVASAPVNERCVAYRVRGLS